MTQEADAKEEAYRLALSGCSTCAKPDKKRSSTKRGCVIWQRRVHWDCISGLSYSWLLMEFGRWCSIGRVRAKVWYARLDGGWVWMLVEQRRDEKGVELTARAARFAAKKKWLAGPPEPAQQVQQERLL